MSAQHIDEIDWAAVDPGGLMDLVEASPAQWADALEHAPTCPDPSPPASAVRLVLVAGLGGSGIAGDVASIAAAELGGAPVLTVKGPELPACAGADTLVIAVSHSGGTEEVLSCLRQAGEAGAPRYAITTGGELAAQAEAAGVPHAVVRAPGPPRANLARLAVPLLTVLERCGLLPEGVVTEQLGQIPDHLRALVQRWGRSSPYAENEAKRLADALVGHLPVLYGEQGWPALVAMRGRTQINENAEVPAFASPAPEFTHNEIVGWSSPGEVAVRTAAVLVRSPLDETTRSAQVLDAATEMLRGRVASVHTLTLAGPSPLARFAAGALHLDLVSVYLAAAMGTDPSPISAIDELKRAVRG